MQLKIVVLLSAAVIARGLTACSSPETTDLNMLGSKIGVVDCKNNKFKLDDNPRFIAAEDRKYEV